jgi:YegS/Rv2252/BmrU family lipid kinase
MAIPLVIVNPSSASGATGSAWPGVASDLRSQFGPFNVEFTQKRGDAMMLAAAAAGKTELIIACGGDGTISEVANGILNSGKDVELGILPSGTGGDFRRTIGIPTHSRQAAQILRAGKTRVIDVGSVTFVSHHGHQTTRYFVGVSSFGMSAEVIERVKKGGSDWLSRNGPKWLTGPFSFGLSMMQTAMKSSVASVVVQLDDEHEQNLTVANLCIANARYFGGGMKIAPEARLNDGKLDVISIGDLGAFKILVNAPRLYAGSHLSMDKVGHALAEKIIARPTASDAEISLEVDGELPGRLPATFQIVPNALRIRCPVKS